MRSEEVIDLAAKLCHAWEVRKNGSLRDIDTHRCPIEVAADVRFGSTDLQHLMVENLGMDLDDGFNLMRAADRSRHNEAEDPRVPELRQMMLNKFMLYTERT